MWEIYYTPRSVDEVLDLLARYGKEARIIAGGTDIIIELERKIRRAPILIDITHIPGLDEITLDDQGWIHLGPLVTHNRVVASPLMVERAFPLARACWEVGAPQIRNRGTIAGNLITASPANDTITPLWAMDATVTLASARGRRTLTFPEFFLGVRQTAMADDEMMVDIACPALKPGERGTFIKVALRRAQAVSVVNIAAVVDFDGPVVRQARLAYGSVAPTIVRAHEAEAWLVGKTLDEAVIRRAGELAMGAARPIDDVRATAEYRREMVRVTTERALRALRAGTEREDWPAHPVMLWGHTDGRFPTGPGPMMEHRTDGDEVIVTRINGQLYTIRGANDKTLLRMLREDAGLTGTKEGCAEGECGACTVFLDGMAVMACMVAAPRAHGAEIVTVEGLARDGNLHPIQQAFIEEGAVQCGYCTPGFIMAGAMLLAERPWPSRWEIAQSITGNLCRCTGYYKILAAIERAAQMGRRASDKGT